MVFMGPIEICVPGVFKLHYNITLFSMLLKSFLMSHNSLCNVRNLLQVPNVDFVHFFFDLVIFYTGFIFAEGYQYWKGFIGTFSYYFRPIATLLSKILGFSIYY